MTFANSPIRTRTRLLVLSDHGSTVHGEHDAGSERGFGAGELDDPESDFFRPTDSAQRHVLDKRLPQGIDLVGSRPWCEAIGVEIGPGATATTRTPRVASCTAQLRVSESSAALAAA